MNAPWFEDFRRDPGKAVADLFSGRAGAGSDLRLDVPELLYQQFPPNLADERAQLDDALGSWLLDMREGYASQVKRLGFAVYGKRVGDALVALQLLDLPRTRDRFRTDTGTWLRWLSPLRLAPERDPALECFRLLTRGQPDARHTALWLRLAADPRPEYLTVALAGLRLLPNQDNARKNQTLMLQALLRHTVKNRHEASAARTFFDHHFVALRGLFPLLQALLRHTVKNRHEASAARTFFDHHFAALRGLFPHGPQYWNRVLDEALDDFLEHTEEPIARELAGTLRPDLRIDLQARHRHPSSGRARMPMPGTPDEWGNLKNDFLGSDHRPETLARRLFEILECYHDYAEATGVSHFFVRTLHNLGTVLLERHALGSADMSRFGVMIERALVWEPANPYCWMLWAEWFKIQDQRVAHEATLREMLRLFPSNLPARAELARLLLSRGEAYRDEAEHHLRNARDRDPSDEHLHEVMAQLQILRHRSPEAEAEARLAEFVERHPDNATVRALLGRLRAHTYLDTTAATFDDDPPIPLPGALQELLRRGSLAGEFSRAQIAMDRGLAAPTNLIRQESLKGDPLAGFYSQWLMPEETPECPPHAWAWQACRYWQASASPDDWLRLATQFPEAAPETEFLRVLATPDGDRSGAVGWRDRYCFRNNGASRAVDAFMREAQERFVGAGLSEREELAGTVMACAAADALDVVWESAA